MLPPHAPLRLKGLIMVPVFTLRELESASGEPRSTIYYYLGRGLLPKPQKTASGRSLYTEEHLNLLREIAKLRSARLSLFEIERELHHKVAQADEMEVDLVAQEHERTHNRILAVAADEFFAKSYKDTHVNDIIQRLGITVSVFYAHFPSKHALLGECVVALVDWSNQYVEYQRPLIHDPIEELLWSLFAQFRVFQLGAAARAVLEVGGPSKNGGLQQPLEAAHASVVDRIARVIRELRSLDQQSSEVEPELLAECIFGAADLLFRFSRPQHNRKQLIRAYLHVLLSLVVPGNSHEGTGAAMAPYDKLVDYFSTHMPPRPPVLELQPVSTPAVS